MSAPKEPRAVESMVSDIVDRLTHDPAEGTADARGQRVPWCLACSYRWAYNAAHSRTVGEPSGTRALGTSDPTGGAAGDKEHLRSALRYASEQLRMLQGLQQRLEAALARADGPHGQPVFHNARTSEIADEDLAAAVAAQARRSARGEGWGAA